MKIWMTWPTELVAGIHHPLHHDRRTRAGERVVHPYHSMNRGHQKVVVVPEALARNLRHRTQAVDLAGLGNRPRRSYHQNRSWEGGREEEEQHPPRSNSPIVSAWEAAWMEQPQIVEEEGARLVPAEVVVEAVPYHRRRPLQHSKRGRAVQQKDEPNDFREVP